MNYSSITDYLLLGTTPASRDYDTLRDLGVGLVINMRFERRPNPDPHTPPMAVLWLPVFDHWLIPIPIPVLRKGVEAALGALAQGRKVYAHCASGIHRASAMGAAILIAQGYSPEDAMRLIREQRRVADPYAWYIRRRIVKFGEVWNHLR